MVRITYKSKRGKRTEKGLTFAEIMVVVAVIGIIAALAVPDFLNMAKQARIKECDSNMRSIDAALKMCHAQNNDWTGCNVNYVNYLPGGVAPICPFTDNDYSANIQGNAAVGFTLSRIGTDMIDHENH